MGDDDQPAASDHSAGESPEYREATAHSCGPGRNTHRGRRTRCAARALSDAAVPPRAGEAARGGEGVAAAPTRPGNAADANSSPPPSRPAARRDVRSLEEQPATPTPPRGGRVKSHDEAIERRKIREDIQPLAAGRRTRLRRTDHVVKSPSPLPSPLSTGERGQQSLTLKMPCLSGCRRSGGRRAGRALLPFSGCSPGRRASLRACRAAGP